MQLSLFTSALDDGKAPARQLLKWIGNKQRFAAEIVRYFPRQFGCYYEPFIGSGAVLATLAPRRGVGSDTFRPLIEIWQAVRNRPAELKKWYRERHNLIRQLGKTAAYHAVLVSYNKCPNGPDLLFLCRACYGGVVRFRQHDGYMSTPCGVHDPIDPESFDVRVDDWHTRVEGTEFRLADYREVMNQANAGDLVYCDPPYKHSQAILYGAQSFDLGELFETIERCKARGVLVALSIDGTKKSGTLQCSLPIPDTLFEREILIDCGRSMLKRFQMNGRSLEAECVSDRLMLTF
jgi:DNA adenine methylase